LITNQGAVASRICETEDNLCIRISVKMIQLLHWCCNDKWQCHAVAFATFRGWLSLRLWGLIWNQGPLNWDSHMRTEVQILPKFYI